MRHVTLFLIPLFLLMGCTQKPLQKAQNSVKNYILKNVNDPSSYQSIEFGKLDSAFSKFIETDYGGCLVDSIINLKNECDTILSKYHEIKYTNSMSRLKYYTWYEGSKYDRTERHQMDSLLKGGVAIENLHNLLASRLDTLQKQYKPVFDGYIILHSFRAKNKMGNLVIEKYVFRLDKYFEVKNALDLD